MSDLRPPCGICTQTTERGRQLKAAQYPLGETRGSRRHRSVPVTGVRSENNNSLALSHPPASVSTWTAIGHTHTHLGTRSRTNGSETSPVQHQVRRRPVKHKTHEIDGSSQSALSHSVFICPFFRQLSKAVAVCLVYSRDFRHKWVVRVRIRQQRADR